MTIYRFTEEYRFLSNFWFAEVLMYGLPYPSVEHAYQAAKTFDLEQRETIRNASTPGQAKKLGRKITLRADWETFKVPAMTELVRRKFTVHHDLGQLLLATGEQELIEGNHWHDTFWGVCECDSCQAQGDNRLGQILMTIRDELWLQGTDCEVCGPDCPGPDGGCPMHPDHTPAYDPERIRFWQERRG